VRLFVDVGNRPEVEDITIVVQWGTGPNKHLFPHKKVSKSDTGPIAWMNIELEEEKDENPKEKQHTPSLS
jgi:hypothetical protein